MNKKYAGIHEAFIAIFPPSTVGGFKLQIEDCAGLGYQPLDDATRALRRPGLAPGNFCRIAAESGKEFRVKETQQIQIIG